jgi:signal-transduction protein with cAMP-binding, CBS, and nucleotidyltransferase domain
METVGEILKDKGRTIHFTSPGATIFDAVEAMCRHHVGALLVRAGVDAPGGILSERDVMTRVILAKRDPTTTLVEEVMTRSVVCVTPQTRAREAMAVMTERRCRHLPVVLDGRVVGMLSIGDLVRWASHEQEFEIRMLTDYVQGSAG